MNRKISFSISLIFFFLSSCSENRKDTTKFVSDSDIISSRKVHSEQLKDPYRSLWHINISEGRGYPFDPNGAIFHNGIYHMWYIYQSNLENPYTHNGKKIFKEHRWQHISSKDLFHWRWHSNSLLPNFEHDEIGVFSGNAFKAKDGNIVISYHGLGSDGNSVAFSDDVNLNRWSKSENNPIAKLGWDPHMWYDDEKEIYFQISGNKPSSNNKPILYSGNDYKLPLKEVGSFMAYDMPDVEAHEDISCPDFFKLQDKWVLVLISHSRGARYYIGEWKDNKFFPESHKRINFPGGPIFAPETLLDDKGRRIMWAWLYDGKTRENIKNKGVSDGVMSMPRVLSLSKDKMSLRMKPPKEIENLRYNYSTVNNEFILEPNKNLFLENIKGNSIELYVEIDSKKAKKFGLNVLSSRDGNEHTKIFIDKDQSLLGIDVSRSSAQNPKYSQYMMIKGDEYKNKTTKVQSAPFKINDGEIIKLRIFIDKSIIEVFANDGMQSITQVVFPTNEDSVHVELFSDDSEIIVKKINSWSLFPSMQW